MQCQWGGGLPCSKHIVTFFFMAHKLQASGMMRFSDLFQCWLPECEASDRTFWTILVESVNNLKKKRVKLLRCKEISFAGCVILLFYDVFFPWRVLDESLHDVYEHANHDILYKGLTSQSQYNFN